MTSSIVGVATKKGSAHRSRLGPTILPSFALLAAVVAAYSNTMDSPFQFDDSLRIVANEKIRNWWPPFQALSESNRPLVNYTFAINYAFHGIEVRGYHAVNLAIHVAASWVLFGVVRRTLERFRGKLGKQATFLACFIALIWAVHPLQTQAVTYINQRYESLMGLMYLLTLYAFIRSIDAASKGWQVASVVACGLGMTCKEVMVSAPLIVLWYDRAMVAAHWTEIWRNRKYYYLFLFSTWAILAWSMLHYTKEYQHGGMIVVEKVTPWTYLLSQSEVITYYLMQSIWPHRQCFFDQWPTAERISDVLPEAAFIVMLLIFTIGCMRWYPPHSLLGGWFFLILSPTSSIFPIRDFMFEHRMYLPLASMATLFVLGTQTLANRIPYATAARWLSVSTIAIVAIMLSLTTYLRNEVYRSEVALWQDTVDKAPHHAAAWFNLATSLVKQGKTADGLTCFAKAVALAPEDRRLHSSYGAALMESGQYEQAKNYLQSAIEHAPDDSVALANMGNLLLDTGEAAKAIPYCEKAVRLAPQNAEMRLSLVAALIVVGRFEEALAHCQAVLAVYPKYAKAHLNLVSIYMQTGNKSQAITHAREAVSAEPQSAVAQETLGLLLADDSAEDGVKHLRLACELDSANLDFRRALAKSLIQLAPDEAISLYRSLIAIDSLDIESRYHLVSLLIRGHRLQEAIDQMETVLKYRPESQAAKDYLEKIRAAIRQDELAR